jgi:hypothetical protein
MGRPKNGYTLADGTPVPGTTTIIGRFKDSGPLIYWAWTQGKTGLDFRATSKQAADAGTIAHDMVEASIKGETFEPPPGTDPAVLAKAAHAFAQWQAWAKQSRLKIVATERALVSEKYRFGGTLDAVGKLGRKFCLLDWKSSNGIYPDYLLQLAAYALLLEECEPKWKTDEAHIIRFSKEHADFEHRSFTGLADAKHEFLLLREAFDIDKLIKARVK